MFPLTLKTRVDKLLVDRGLAGSRERAQSLILAGKVLINGQKVEKAGMQVAADATVRLLGEDLKYVSRGGLKLERALEYWKVDVKEKSVLMLALRPADSRTVCCSVARLV